MSADRAAPGLIAKHNEATAIVERMTLEEKAGFASGKSFWHLPACERLGVPSVMVTDGPHGLRKQSTSGDHVGLNTSVPATCFPTASALASTWDPKLLFQVGVALGEQCTAEDVAVLLGPGMNIKRHPLCGRNFEYFSEDPMLTGEMAAALIYGIQSQGVGTSIKHFAVNNQEYGRMFVDAIVDERTLREIYLRGFEMAVRRAQPWTVMCAYNRVNGTYCSEHDWLLNQVLREEWGFQGLVMTDWGATNDRVSGVANGLDLEMPSSGGANDARLAAAVHRGQLSEALLDKAIVRNVSLALCGADLTERNIQLDQDVHHALARQVAAESAVLLKNDDQLLPLAPAGRVAVIGAFAKTPRYQGTGSSQVTPTRLDCAFDAIVDLLGDDADVVYAPGYEAIRSAEDTELIQQATAAARDADVVIVFAGLPVTYESEGFDRDHMRLPEQHNRLIEAVSQVNGNTAVVLSNGAPVEMPWIDSVRAVLECYLSGQAGGGAAAELLFGKANPCGKLAETFPLAQEDVPADAWFPGAHRQVQYREGLYVGYRYFDSAAKPVLFPFGHGLSYTHFEYADLSVAQRADSLLVQVTVSNTGEVAGAEVVQVYVHHPASQAARPEQELKAFAKSRLQPGESQRVELHIPRDALAIYDRGAGKWVVEGAAMHIRVGASSRDIRLAAKVEITATDTLSDAARIPGPEITPAGLQVSDQTFAAMLGHDVPAPESGRPFTMNSTLEEIQDTWLGKRVKARVAQEFQKTLGVTDRDADPTLARMFEEMTRTMPLRGFALFSRGKIGFKQIQILVALLNWRFAQAIRILTGRNTEW